MEIDDHNSKIVIPRIGMRIIKSGVAVLLCFIVHTLRNGNGLVFYSQLAALWCIQTYRSNTKNNARQRIIGTTVGALFGLAYLLLFTHVLIGLKYCEAIEAVLISLMIVAVLYTTVLINKKQSSYFSCVVFLSIVINHAMDVNPYLFVWHRFLDTMIGIIIGILINNVRVCFHPDRNTLFISGLDDTLLDKKEHLSVFSKFELNRMIDDGMKFTLSTLRTPAVINETMKDVRLRLPVIVMDGAALFDVNSNSYLKTYVMSVETSTEVMELILSEDICWYANVIIDDMLVIYYDDTDDDANTRLLEDLRSSLFRNYVKRPLPKDERVTYFMLLDRDDKIESFYEKLREKGYLDTLKVLKYPSETYEGHSYIKIFSKNATKENMINYLKQLLNVEKIVTFGTVEGKYDVIINSVSANEVVKTVRRLYEPAIWQRK